MVVYLAIGLLRPKVNKWCPIHWLRRFLFHQPHNRSAVRYCYIIRPAECRIEIQCHLVTSLVI